MAEQVLRLEQVCKAYNIGEPSETEVLHSIDMELNAGEFLALMGPSGSGKSTLLNIIGLLDRPTSGRVWIKGRDMAALDDAELTRTRGHTIGFVFQSHMLISAFTAQENVMMPMLVDRGFASAAIEARAAALLGQVGLEKVAGNLDSVSTDGVFVLLRHMNRDNGTSFLIVTHNLELAKRCDRIIEVIDGRIAA